MDRVRTAWRPGGPESIAWGRVREMPVSISSFARIGGERSGLWVKEVVTVIRRRRTQPRFTREERALSVLFLHVFTPVGGHGLK